ncbi:28204_t:CDS:2 [Racocetra persica]|uniref:28204_t:CDS:1 n=1 Tax=Racocetra persica TaxID=160502 RepID=A0ACA9KUI5_9GLOM|nr:28204_t:CDS:2 [Racocetra persica]
MIQIGLDAGYLAIQKFNNFIKNFIIKYTPKHLANNLENSDLDYVNESSSQNYSNVENIDPSLIQNPIIHPKKGTSRKTCFKKFQKLKLKTLERKLTEYQQYYKFGHNKASCEKSYKKYQIPYPF